jgi:hypothetical protein
MRDLDSSVSIARGYGLDDPCSIPGSERFSFLHNAKSGSRAHPPSYPMGTGAFPSGVKGQGREADYSPPSRAEIKNGGAIPSLPHMFS